MPVILENEYKYFQEHLKDFLTTHLHQYVVIKDDQIVDFFGSYEEALKAGLKKLGNVPFLIKQIKNEEEVHFFQQRGFPI